MSRLILFIAALLGLFAFANAVRTMDQPTPSSTPVRFFVLSPAPNLNLGNYCAPTDIPRDLGELHQHRRNQYFTHYLLKPDGLDFKHAHCNDHLGKHDLLPGKLHQHDLLVPYDGLLDVYGDVFRY